MTAINIQKTYDALLQGVRQLDKLEGIRRVTASILDASEATDYQKSLFMLGAVAQKVAEQDNLHRVIDQHFRTMLKEIHEIIEEQKTKDRWAKEAAEGKNIEIASELKEKLDAQAGGDNAG